MAEDEEGRLVISPNKRGWWVSRVFKGEKQYLHPDGEWKSACLMSDGSSGYFSTFDDALRKFVETYLGKLPSPIPPPPLSGRVKRSGGHSLKDDAIDGPVID